MKSSLLELDAGKVRLGRDKVTVSYTADDEENVQTNHIVVFDASKEGIILSVADDVVDPKNASVVEIYGKNQSGQGYFLKAVFKQARVLIGFTRVWDLDFPFEAQGGQRREANRYDISLETEVHWLSERRETKVESRAVDLSFSGCRLHILDETVRTLEEQKLLRSLLAAKVVKITFSPPDDFIESQARFNFNRKHRDDRNHQRNNLAKEKERLVKFLEEGALARIVMHRFWEYRTGSRILVLSLKFEGEMEIVNSLIKFLERQLLRRLGRTEDD